MMSKPTYLPIAVVLVSRQECWLREIDWTELEEKTRTAPRLGVKYSSLVLHSKRESVNDNDNDNDELRLRLCSCP